MDTTMVVRKYSSSYVGAPVGFRFNPSDQELLGYYLSNKLRGATAAQPFHLPVVDDFSKTKPWEIWNKLRVPKVFTTDLYFFTKLKMASRSRVDRRVGLGTWSEGEASRLIYDDDDDDDDDDDEKEIVDKVVIGRKRKLRYEEKGSEHHGGWFIDEYTLVDAAARSCYDQLVICRLRKNDRSSSTSANGSNKRKSSSSSCASKKKSRVNDVDDHPQQLGQDCTSTLTTSTSTSTYHDHLPQLGQAQEQSYRTTDHDQLNSAVVPVLDDLINGDAYDQELMNDLYSQLGQGQEQEQSHYTSGATADDDDGLFMFDIADLISLDDADCFDYNSALMSSDPVVDVHQALQSLPNYDNNQTTVVFEDQPLTSTTTYSTYAAAGMAQGQVVAGGYSNQYQVALDDMIINDCWSNSFVNQPFMP